MMIHGHIVCAAHVQYKCLAFGTITKLDYTASGMHGFLSGCGGFPANHFFHITRQMTLC